MNWGYFWTLIAQTVIIAIVLFVLAAMIYTVVENVRSKK